MLFVHVAVAARTSHEVEPGCVSGGGNEADDLVGTELLGRYKILEPIGRGGMGAVYRAHQLGVNRDVAVKILLPEAASNASVQKRFEVEAEIISKLRHPNTLKLIDFGRDGFGRMFLVTEYLRGYTLANILLKGPIGEERTIQVMNAIASALVEAHGRGVVHRDLKPSNIFVELIADVEHIKVLDFGIAKLLEQPGVTVVGGLIGTPEFMAPEQAAGDDVDARADIYNLGIIGYQCVTGRLPFRSNSQAGYILKHIHDAPLAPRFLKPPVELDPAFESLLMRCLEKRPEARPQSATNLVQALDAIQELKRARIYDPAAVSGIAPTLPSANRTEVPADPEQADTRLVVRGGHSPTSHEPRLMVTASDSLPLDAEFRARPEGRSRRSTLMALSGLIAAGAAIGSLFVRQAQTGPPALPGGKATVTSTGAAHRLEALAPTPSSGASMASIAAADASIEDAGALDTSVADRAGRKAPSSNMSDDELDPEFRRF